jgi:hypothetical protein
MFFTPSATIEMKNNKHFILAVSGLCIAYFLFQLWFIPYTNMAYDEYWFAHHIYQYLQGLPYRDFLPYKTVLGYYLLSVPFYFSHAIFTPLFLAKYEIALINTLMLLTVSAYITRYFNAKAVLWTLILILSNQLFVIYSASLRVDMLSSWLCLISLILLLNNRISWAGFAIGLAFLVSQKAMWYFAAINVGLAVYFILVERSLGTLKQIFIFNACAIASITLYVIAWSILSSLHTVLTSVFYEGYTQAKISWYSIYHFHQWQYILSNGPALFMLWPLAFLSLFIRSENDIALKPRLFILTYASAALIFIISYQQAFPYNMVFTVPAFMLLYADFLTWLLHIINDKKIISYLSSRQLFWFFSLYIIGLIACINLLGLNASYYLLVLIPLCLSVIISYAQNPAYLQSYNFHSPLALISMLTLLFSGIIYPLISCSLAVLSFNGSYQQSTIKLANSLLNKNESYVAGVPFLYNKDQAIPGLKNLIGPAIDYLYKADDKLKPILISSLYLEATTPEQILQSFKNHPIKLYINNVRIVFLPAKIRNYLYSHYQHYWQSIYLYAPNISPGKKHFDLQFTGDYRIITQSKNPLIIDKKVVHPDTIVHLSQGLHQSYAKQYFRLALVPNPTPMDLTKLEPADRWEAI